jgi:translation initiation factor 1A
MPNKKGKNNSNVATKARRELTFKEDGQEYAQIIKPLGDRRFSCMCFDGVTRVCHIRGAIKGKREFFRPDDIVLVLLRDFEDSKGDILLRYTPEEARNLKNYGELPSDANISKCGANDDGELDINNI